MPTKRTKVGKLTPAHVGNDKALMLEKPEFGHLQALVSKTLENLGNAAYGSAAVAALVRETNAWVDPSPIYTIIRTLYEKGYLGKPEPRDSADGGPPMKVYKLTEQGRAALKAAADHYRAVADYLEGKTPERQRKGAP